MKMLRSAAGLCIMVLIGSSIVWSQTGPGGVGKTDGTSSLKLWLDAADAATKTLNSTSVTQWNDKSGSGNNATQGNATIQPTNNPTGISSRATITFDGANDALYLPDNSVLTSEAPFSFFCLVKPANLSGYQSIYDAGSGGGYTAFETNGTKFNYYTVTIAGAGFDGSTTLSNSTPYILDANSSVTTLTLNVNGSSNGSLAGSYGNVIASNADRTIGGTRAAGQFWNGDIGEVIIYNAKLNSAERNIVGSYLAAKWIVTFAGGPYGGSSNFYENVIGIGQESDGSNTSAKMDGLVLTSNGSLNANGEYLLAGHNVGANSITTNDVGSSGATHRWSRIWYFSKTGTLDGANVQIGFDFSDAGTGSSPVTAGNYRLLYRSGTSGNFSAVTTASSVINGDNMNFTVTDANLIDGYYTIGTTNNSSSPLPVELASFSGTTKGDAVELSWKTATEVNNFGFEIEKSRMQKSEVGDQRSEIRDQRSEGVWEKIGFVEGHGTTNAPKEYSFSNKNLSAGTYSYRLKQIDRDGNFTYSSEVEMTIVNMPTEVALGQNYPNPFNPSTVISYQLSVNSHVSLKVFDVIGREVAILVNEVKEAGYYSAQFDATGLSSGIYFAKLQSGNTMQLKKMVLMK